MDEEATTKAQEEADKKAEEEGKEKTTIEPVFKTERREEQAWKVGWVERGGDEGWPLLQAALVCIGEHSVCRASTRGLSLGMNTDWPGLCRGGTECTSVCALRPALPIRE